MDTLHSNGMNILPNSYLNFLHSNLIDFHHSSLVYILLNNLPDTNNQMHTPSSRIGVLHQLTLLFNIHHIHKSLPVHSTLHLAQFHTASGLCIPLILNIHSKIYRHIFRRMPHHLNTTNQAIMARLMPRTR